MFDSIVMAMWGVFWLFWLFLALGNHTETKRNESFESRWLFWALLIAASWLLVPGPQVFGVLSRRFLPDNILLRSNGLAIVSVGLGFAVWARLNLGEFWSGQVSIRVGHKLIRSGPYRLVRHPIYTGMLLGFIGSAIAIGEARVWLGIILVLAGFWMKIRTEERFLLDEFGQDYTRYKKEVKALIPYVV